MRAGPVALACSHISDWYLYNRTRIVSTNPRCAAVLLSLRVNLVEHGVAELVVRPARAAERGVVALAERGHGGSVGLAWAEEGEDDQHGWMLVAGRLGGGVLGLFCAYCGNDLVDSVFDVDFDR